MKKKKELLHLDYLVLAIGLIIGVAGYAIFPKRSSLQTLSICFLGAFYFLWGVWHHYREGDLRLRILLEYLLVAVLAVVLLLSLILRV